MHQPRLFQSRGAGLNIQLAEWPGDEPTVLAIHGLTANCRCWDALSSAVAPAHRLLALDLRGRGLSDKPQTGYSISKHCLDIKNILESESPVPVTLMGHSLGAYIALVFAAAYPEWVNSLILVDGGAVLSPEQWAKVSAGIKPSLDRLGKIFPSFEDYIAAITRAPFLQPWNQYLEDYYRYESETVPGGLRSRIRAETISEERENLLKTDMSSAYPQVRCPVLILRATQGMLSPDDLVLPEAALPVLLKALPQARLVNLKDCNHFSILFHELPERDRAIHDFLS